jgi:hypothetical protein
MIGYIHKIKIQGGLVIKQKQTFKMPMKRSKRDSITLKYGYLGLRLKHATCFSLRASAFLPPRVDHFLSGQQPPMC